MKEEDISKFFKCLGEIWRDITAIEFLMRCAIAKKDGEIKKFPKPPYTKDKIYFNPPNSFLCSSFEDIVAKFNSYFPKLKLPKEIISLRHAMAHGIIAKINKDDTEQLIKFKKIKGTKTIKVEFNMPLEIIRLSTIQQSLKNLRRYIMEEVDDGKK